MTLRQTIQAAPIKTKELIDKLSATSNQAVKTRETLFAALSEELARYVEIEEKNLLPLLRKQPESRDLADEALKGNRDLRARLTKLAASPKDDDQFLPGVAELDKSFQKHVRNERKELLPAVLKALSDDEARDDLRDKIEGGSAADELVSSVERSTAAAREKARDVAATVTERVQEMASEARQAMTVLGGSATSIAGDLQAVRASSAVAVGAASEVRSTWVGLFANIVRANAHASQRLFRCTSIAQLADVQSELATASMRSWMESSTKVLQIAQRASKQALAPLDGRLTEAPAKP